MAFKEPIAVTGVAPASAIGVKVTVGAAPNAGIGRAGIHIDAPRLALVEPPAPAGGGGGPDGVGALVYDIKCGCMGEGEA